MKQVFVRFMTAADVQRLTLDLIGKPGNGSQKLLAREIEWIDQQPQQARPKLLSEHVTL